jgi:hypothetical protein
LPNAARDAEHLTRHPYKGAQAQIKQQGYESNDAEDDQKSQALSYKDALLLCQLR